VEIIEILPYFQEKMMVQKDPIELENTNAWSKRSKFNRVRL